MPPDNDTKKYVSTASVSRALLLLMDCVPCVSRVKSWRKKNSCAQKYVQKQIHELPHMKLTDEGQLFTD